MKKPIKRVLKVLVLGILLLVAAVNLLTPGMPEATEADLGLTLQLEDGSVATLGELLEREQAMQAAADEAEPDVLPEPRAHLQATLPSPGLFGEQGVFGLGLRRLAQGRHEDALKIWRAIPDGHHDYARAQRFIGYKIYDRALRQPAQGVAYVNRSIWSDPFSGNAWQDAVRIYWHTAVDAFR